MNETMREIVFSQGYHLVSIPLPPLIREFVENRQWSDLDRAIRKEADPGGAIFNELSRYEKFSQIEFIISIRSSLKEPDEDGIWHDDGSRVLAFSLSLTLDHHLVEGGRLEIRKRRNLLTEELAESAILPTPSFGTMIVFATGVRGFEHKINRVIQGERIIIAGWCT